MHYFIMISNKYKILAKFPEKNPSMQHVIDLLYSTFSFKLFNEYLQDKQTTIFF